MRVSSREKCQVNKVSNLWHCIQYNAMNYNRNFSIYAHYRDTGYKICLILKHNSIYTVVSTTCMTWTNNLNEPNWETSNVEETVYVTLWSQENKK